jgi:hypothetical protein
MYKTQKPVYHFSALLSFICAQPILQPETSQGKFLQICYFKLGLQIINQSNDISSKNISTCYWRDMPQISHDICIGCPKEPNFGQQGVAIVASSLYSFTICPMFEFWWWKYNYICWERSCICPLTGTLHTRDSFWGYKLGRYPKSTPELKKEPSFVPQHKPAALNLIHCEDSAE